MRVLGVGSRLRDDIDQASLGVPGLEDKGLPFAARRDRGAAAAGLGPFRPQRCPWRQPRGGHADRARALRQDQEQRASLDPAIPRHRPEGELREGLFG